MTIFQKIKLYMAYRAIKKSFEEADMSKVKSGIKTTEFWVALLGAVIPVINEHLGLNLPTEVIVSTAAILISYILGRSIVKRGS